jgi:Gas vesicle synthesis protein GvpL/GvpF
VELGVRAVAPTHEAAGSDAAGASAASTSGREYVLGKLRERRRTEQAAAALHEPLAAFAAGARRWRVRAPGEVLRAAYLVDRAAVPGFRAGVERLQRRHPGTAILCTGPWPPYSFVEAAATKSPR